MGQTYERNKQTLRCFHLFCLSFHQSNMVPPKSARFLKRVMITTMMAPCSSVNIYCLLFMAHTTCLTSTYALRWLGVKQNAMFQKSLSFAAAIIVFSSSSSSLSPFQRGHAFLFIVTIPKRQFALSPSWKGHWFSAHTVGGVYKNEMGSKWFIDTSSTHDFIFYVSHIQTEYATNNVNSNHNILPDASIFFECRYM